MIYTAKKNGHTRTFSDADGKLLYYRRNRWRISAELGALKEEPRPAPRILKEKAEERGERRFVKLLGRWVIDE